LGKFLPNLEVLVLTNNQLKTLEALKPLESLTQLEHISLIENEVSRNKEYRLYLIHLCPTLRVINFSRVKETERELSFEKYGEKEEDEMEEDDDMMEGDENKEETNGNDEEEKITAPINDQKAIAEALSKATTMEEILAIENQLMQGKIPKAKTTDNKDDVETGGADDLD